MKILRRRALATTWQALQGRRLEVAILLGQAVSLGASILITRLGGPAVRGDVTTVAVWAQLVGWLACFSLDKAIVAQARRTPAQRPETLAYAVRIVAVNLIVVCPIAAVVLAGVLDDVRLVALAVVGICLTAMIELTQGMLLIDERIAAYGRLRLLQPLVYLVGLAVLVPLTTGRPEGSSFTSFVFGIALIVSLAATLLESWRTARPPREVPTPERSTLDRASRRAVLTFAAQAQLATALQFLNARLDLLVLPFFVSASEVGVYAVASGAAQFVALGGTAAYVRHFSLGHRARDRGGLLIACGLAAVLTASASWVLPAVFGREFRASASLARILSIGGIATFGALAATGVLLAAHRPKAVVAAQGAGVTLFVAGIVIDQDPRWIAWVSTTSFVVSWVVAEALARSSPTEAVAASPFEALPPAGAG
jgi:O-antigen/teichoic acid export membrane protein